MSQVVSTYIEKREIVARSYANGGCPIKIDKKKCGETKGLEIIMDFHKLYQERINQIDVSAGGDSLQEKVDLQQDWINDLTEQNRMLAKVIQELEIEAIGRVQHLEEKLKNAAKSFGETDHRQDLDQKIEEPSITTSTATEEIKKKEDEIESLKQKFDELKLAMSDEIANKHDTVSLLKHEIIQHEKKNLDFEKEILIKDDIIKELRKEMKKLKHKLSPKNLEKSTNTKQFNEYRTIHRNKDPQISNNSTVIFIHKGKTDSSDSECGLNETYKPLNYSSKSENDIKLTDWIKPTKDNGKPIEINEIGDHKRKNKEKNLNIPKHIPVKTYVNNIEYTKDID